MALKLGRKPSKEDTRTLQFGTYTRADLPVPPVAVNRSRSIPDHGWGMMGNDTHCDCTCAAAGHMIRLWTANTGREVVVPDAKILEFYGHFNGGNPQEGADMMSVLRYWRKAGLNGHIIHSYVALALRHPRQLMEAVSLFGAAYIGLGLPNFAVPQGEPQAAVPWVVPASGRHGDAACNSAHGHCVPVVGYDADHVYTVTWGILKPMTWEFYAAYTEEAFVVLSPDWLGPGQRAAPSGFDLAGLERDLRRVASV